MKAKGQHTNQYLMNLCKIQKDLEKRFEELQPKQKELDKQQDQILHLLELENLNSTQREKAIKKLIEIRKERRVVKLEMSDIHSTLKCIKFDSHSTPKYEIELTYEYSENIVNAVYGEEE